MVDRHGVGTETLDGASRKLASKLGRKIKMFPGESYDPVLSCWSSGSFSSDVGKVGGLTANHGLDTATAARPWRRHTPPRTSWLGAEKRWRICDVWNYPFATHMYMIFRVSSATRARSRPTLRTGLQSVKCPTRGSFLEVRA